MKTMLLSLLFAAAGVCQPISFGVKGGVPLDRVGAGAQQTIVDKERWIIGPTIEARLTMRFTFGAEALYRRLGYNSTRNVGSTLFFENSKTDHWGFPLFLKYSIGGGPVRPFVLGGGAFEHANVYGTFFIHSKHEPIGRSIHVSEEAPVVGGGHRTESALSGFVRSSYLVQRTHRVWGVGGSPGDSVYLKAGGSTDEPLASLAEAGEVRLTIDKGQQSVGGRDAGVAGTIANGKTCDGQSWPYISFRTEYAHPFPVRTDDRAVLWLIAGTDSAYEGLTGLYFESITVRLSPSVQATGRASSASRPRQ